MDQEAEFCKKRMIDLSKRAEDKNIVTFSNFLNLNEWNLFHQISKELYSSFEAFGGYDYAERQMVAFIPDALYYVWEYPIRVIEFTPVHRKYAEVLTHRDVLGALMNLGIKREMLGDIVVMDDCIFVFCVDVVSQYIIDHCTKIRHTNIHAQQTAIADFHYEPKFIEKDSTIASLRLDTIIADVCKLPRSAAQKIISEGNAFINAKKILQNDYNCQDGDILSVRHIGKFQIASVGNFTKKGRIRYRYKIYC